MNTIVLEVNGHETEYESNSLANTLALINALTNLLGEGKVQYTITLTHK